MKQSAIGAAVTALVIGCVSLPASAQQPDSTNGPEAIRRFDERLRSVLAGSTYDGLDPLQKNTVRILAANAVLMVEAGECSDPSVAGSAAESFLFTFVGLGRKALQPIFDLSAPRKSELVDKAISLASELTPDADLANWICHGALLPAPSSKPVFERLQAARQVLTLGLTSPTSNTPAQSTQPGGQPVAHPERSVSQSNPVQH